MARRVVGQELQVGANVASACTQDREGIELTIWLVVWNIWIIPHLPGEGC